MSVKTIMVEVCKCSRCDGNHDRVEFRKFTRPVECGGERLDYWGMCPVLNEPIFRSPKPPQNDYAGRTIREDPFDG